MQRHRRNLFWIGLLFTHENGDFGAISVTERNCACADGVVSFVNGRYHSDLLLKVFLLKRKKIATQGRPWTSNSDLSYPTLSSLPLHYHTPTIQTRQNSEQKAESHISDKCSYYTGWQEMISDILRTEHGLNLQKALNDNFPKSLCKTSFIREPVTGLS